MDKWPGIIRRILTLLAVLIGWVIFRQTSLPALGECLQALIHPSLSGLGSYLTVNGKVLENTFWLVPAVAGCFPLGRILKERFEGKRWFFAVSSGWAFLVFLISLALLVGATYNPFIYFRF